MLNERWRRRRSSVQSSKCQHVAAVQFVSSAGKDHASSGQHPCFAPNWFIQFRHTWRLMCILSEYHMYTKPFVFLRGLRKQQPRSAQGLFRNKSVWTTATSIVPMREGWWKLRMLRYDEFNVPTCWKHFRFVSCAMKDSLCATVMMAWIWHCLDQCHGVRSHGTSFSQGWRKRIVVQSTIQI